MKGADNMNKEAAKIYGIYPGLAKNINHLETCAEDDLYHIIKHFAKQLDTYQRLTDKLGVKTTDHEYLKELRFTVDFCINNTKRFGVVLLEPTANHYVEQTPSYQTWYGWWDQYFEKDITDEDCRFYNIAKLNHEDTSDFRPKGDWNEPNEKDKALTLK